MTFVQTDWWPRRCTWGRRQAHSSRCWAPRCIGRRWASVGVCHEGESSTSAFCGCGTSSCWLRSHCTLVNCASDRIEPSRCTQSPTRAELFCSGCTAQAACSVLHIPHKTNKQLQRQQVTIEYRRARVKVGGEPSSWFVNFCCSLCCFVAQACTLVLLGLYNFCGGHSIKRIAQLIKRLSRQ